MTAPAVPRIIPLLAVLALLTYFNAKLPGVLNAILGVIVLYVVLTHIDAAEQLFAGFQGSLTRLYPVTATPAPVASRGR